VASAILGETVAPALGFVPLPWPFFVFLVGATATYLALVQWAKARILPRFAVRAGATLQRA